ncbi:MAG: PEP-CTERM sorting domain-containing protein [Alphaproteobacteria bacterium]|nr:PEP-CTERM sorting domain-containing protein [Alphaproteobacteria bacterium]
MTRAGLIVLMALCSSPCGAAAPITQMFSGTLAGPDSQRSLHLPMIGRGTASLLVETDRPVQFMLYDHGELRYNYICPPGTGDCGGNEILFVNQYGPFTGNVRVTSRMVWRNAYRNGQKVYSLGYGEQLLYFTVPGNQPLQYRVTQSFIGQVPEPASWLMMIAGFGLVGAVARRQRLSPPAPGAADRAFPAPGDRAPARG